MLDSFFCSKNYGVQLIRFRNRIEKIFKIECVGDVFTLKILYIQRVKIHKALSELITGPAKGANALAASEIYKAAIYTHTVLKFSLYDQMIFNI